MAAKTILVANRKGGCGKTTVAVTLAAALAARGARVGLADADPQKSALQWLKRRPEGAAALKRLNWTSPKSLGEAPKGLDWVIIDAPGSLDGEEAQTLVAEARAVLVPVQPSFFDADSTRRFLADLQEIKRVRKGKVGIDLIANRVRPRARASARLDAFLAEIGQPPLARIAERAAYGDLAAEGLAVFDRPQAPFRALQAQWAPVLKALG